MDAIVLEPSKVSFSPCTRGARKAIWEFVRPVNANPENNC
jgi:hypothetical protein